MFTIEDNVPIPETVRGRASKYPLKEMAVGQSFEVDLKEAAQLKTLRTTIYKAAQTLKSKGSTSSFKVAATTETKARVWRTA